MTPRAPAVSALTVSLLAAAVMAAALTGCGERPGPAGPSVVSGSLVLAPGQLLPAGMPVELELVEPGPPQQGVAPLATTQLEWGAAPETAFTLAYDAEKTATGTRYVVRARARLQGTTYLSGEALAPVPATALAVATDVVLRRPADAPLLYLDVSVLHLEHKREDDWSRALREVMPAIQVCLRSVSGEGIAVTRAGPAGGGRIGVRIRTRDGSGFDCRALPDGSKFESLSGLPSFAEKLPGEGQPAFVPAPGSPRMDPCLRYERVLGALDEPLGWLVYNTCPDGTEAAAPPASPAAGTAVPRSGTGG